MSYQAAKIVGHKATDRPNHAIFHLMVAVLLFALQDVFIKSLPSTMPVVEIVFFRSIFAFIPLFFLAFMEKHPRIFKTTKPFLQVSRAVMGFVMTFLFIASYRLIPLAEAYALSYTAPLFITLLSIPLLKEKVGYKRWFAVIVGFAGVLFILRPGFTEFSWGAIFAVVGSVFNALSLLGTRFLSNEDSIFFIVFTFTFVSMALSGLILPFFWTPIDLWLVLQFVLIGITGGSAQIAIAYSFKLAPASYISPFDYASLIWALAFGYIFWNDVPNYFMVTGSLIIIGAGIYLVTHERLKS